MTTPIRPPRRDLDALLDALPREVSPSRDLWPGIEAAIAPPRAGARRRWPLALAAGLAVVAVGGIVGLRMAAPPAVVAEAPRGNGAVTPAEEPMRDVATRESEFRATRAALRQTYEERLKMLSPATRARIAADLATIQRAQQDLRDALASEPDSRVLLRLYESATQQEFDLYTTVGRNTEPAAARTRT